MPALARLLSALLATAAAGALATGCGGGGGGGGGALGAAGTSITGSQSQTGQSQSNQATQASAVPAEPTEGRLVARHYQAHPELGFSLFPPEPMAPRGRWMNSPAGIPVWVPDWLSRSALLGAALQEVDQTEPEADARIPAGTKGPDLSRRPRVIICDAGGFSYAVENGGSSSQGTLLARGLTAFDVWPESATDLRDVMWVAFRLSSKESGKLLPAYNHELRHHHTQDRLGE